MSKQEMKEVIVKLEVSPEDLEPFDFPITFICGKEMIELFGVKEPIRGMVVYLFHSSEIREHGTDWIPDLSNSYGRLQQFCLTGSLSYADYIEEFLKLTKIEPGRTWELKKLKSINPIPRTSTNQENT